MLFTQCAAIHLLTLLLVPFEVHTQRFTSDALYLHSSSTKVPMTMTAVSEGLSFLTLLQHTWDEESDKKELRGDRALERGLPPVVYHVRVTGIRK